MLENSEWESSEWVFALSPLFNGDKIFLLD
jgi:hypothetical protein